MIFGEVFGHILVVILLFGTIPRYSTVELKRLRRTSAVKQSLQWNVFYRLQELELWHFRGCRGGFQQRSRRNWNRHMCSEMGQYQECEQYLANVNNIDNIINDEQVCQIPSIVSNRSVDMLQKRKTVNQNNLISVEISASKPKALMGLMNCQSANKNGDSIKDYIHGARS